MNIVLAFGGAPQRLSIVCRRNGFQLCCHNGIDGRTKDIGRHIRPALLPSFWSPNDRQQASLGSMASSITPRCCLSPPLSIHPRVPPSFSFFFPFVALMYIHATSQSIYKKKDLYKCIKVPLFPGSFSSMLAQPNRIYNGWYQPHFFFFLRERTILLSFVHSIGYIFSLLSRCPSHSFV